MKSRKFLLAAAVLSLSCDVTLVNAAPAPGGPAKTAPAPVDVGIDAAKKALAEKRYDDVDIAVAKELTKKLPDPAAIRVSLDAALASGKMVTANQRANELLKASAGHDLDVLFTTAYTADTIGDSRAALVRYLSFARQSDTKSGQSAYALEYVLKRDAYPEEYKKFVKLYGNDAHAWRVGMGQLAKLIDAADVDRTLDLAGYLLDTFPEPDRTDKVHELVRNAADNYVFGKDAKDRYLKPLLVLSRHAAKDAISLEPILSGANPALTAESRMPIMLDLMAHVKAPLTPPMLSLFGADLRSIKSDELQASAGRAYVAAAPLYAAAEQATHYAYLRVQMESPAVFHGKDNPLVSIDGIEKAADAYIAKYPEDVASARQFIAWITQGYVATDIAARSAELKNHLAVLSPAQLAELASLEPGGNTQALLDKWSAGRSFKDVLEARMNLLPQFNAAKDKAAVLSAARDFMAAYPLTSNWDAINSQVVGSPLLDNNEKLALLKESLEKSGAGGGIRSVVAQMARGGTWAKDAGYKDLKAAVDAKPTGKDPIAATLVALHAFPAADTLDTPVNDTAGKFLASYKGVIPAGDENLASVEDILVQQIFDEQLGHISNKKIAVAPFAQMWAPRLPLGSNWEKLAARVRDSKDPETSGKILPTYAEKVRAAGGAAAGSKVIWRDFWNAASPDGPLTSPLSKYYDLMGSDAAAGYLIARKQTFDTRRRYLVDELAKALAANGGKLTDPVVIRAWMSHLWTIGSDGVTIPAAVNKSVWNSYLAYLQAGGSIDLAGEVRVHAIYIWGRNDAEAAAFLADYLKLIEKRGPEQELMALSELYHSSNPPADGVRPGSRRGILLNTVMPLLEKLSPRNYDAQMIPSNAVNDIASVAVRPLPKEGATAELAEQRDRSRKLARIWLKMIAGGAKVDGPPNAIEGFGESFLNEALAEKDGRALADAAAAYGEMLSRENTINERAYSSQIAPVVKALEDAGADEASYIFISHVQLGKPIDSVNRQLVLSKSKAATRIKGLIPVPATDPTYDLYIASASLLGGDETKAWELTAPKLKLLLAGWEGFDSRYVAWASEQMRKQKMLKDALEFTFNILLHETDLDADTAGKVLLTQSDTYKDMENYQAARAGFEGLKNNARYAKTEAGEKAGYRLVELHILTKDYTAAETLLERMADSDDVKKQAEAYYLYAEMAFRQGQYKEAKDDLKKVKDRVANHVEAALLEGELNLILPGGLANTEVAVGDPRLSTVAIPGRFLQLELQDTNLSVARGGSAIPVIVTTSKGGDVEHVKLLPSSSNKSLFTARIATALGKAVKDNLTLELLGDDVVSYIIDPDFQKANDLHYPPKVLEVRSDGRLVASSGEILSEDEEEKRELERQLRRREVIESRRLDIARDGRTIRPGSPIYVQVTDPDQDRTDAPDTVKIDLRTSSGESLEGYSVVETGPHTGVFRAAVPTGIQQATVYASDFDEAKDPNSAIRPGAGDGWLSQADGHKNKWLEVDTMSSHQISSVSLEIPHLDTIKDVALLGVLADDYEELASLPARAQDTLKGGVQIETSVGRVGDTVEIIRRRLKVAATDTIEQEQPVLSREATALKVKAPNGGYGTMHLRGAFYLGDNQALELQYLQPYENFAMNSHVLIDGQEVLGRFTAQTAQLGSRIDLTKGTHIFEILVSDNHAASKIIVGFRQPDGNFLPLPADWFSVKAHPELVESLRPKGKLTAKGDILTATFETPVRLRKIRALFRDFTGTGIAVKRITVTDEAGQPVIPAPPDAAGAKGILHIAPGDQVFVSYSDVKRLYGDSKVLSTTLNSSFYNGNIVLAEERITANPNDPTSKSTTYLEAKRCRAGDQLMVIVTDYDEDSTDSRDVIPVTVKTSSGETLALKALETAIVNPSPERHAHAGQFLAILKFGDQTKGDTIKVSPGDKITVSYIDRENTNPGIPIGRSYTVTEAGAETPRLLVYRTNVKMIPDDSAEAKARVKRIVGRENKNAILYKAQAVARHPDYVPLSPTTQPAFRKEIIASVSAPLLFEVTYPRRALNQGSVLEVTAVAESELQAAAKEKREPTVLKVPTYVEDIDKLARIKGYPIQLLSAMRRDGKDMLKAGAFSGVIRLQVGSKGDPIDDLVLNGEFISDSQRLSDPEGMYFKVPTLVVGGADTVHIRVKDEATGKAIDTPVRLLSDARLELLDGTYMIANESIHLGEKFCVRVTDPDHDTTDERDSITLNVKASSGSATALILTETLPHSGVFTGTIAPHFVRETPTTQASTQSSEAMLKVDFGDTVSFTYVDYLSLESESPVTHTVTGKILLGADAEVVSFTKKFKDPEIAVKTRFLMAEALFETAKEHRKIGQMEQADAEIARGKNILDEALRDYPNTSLAAQGEYLLANLAQELTNYQEAVGRYANVITTWPDSEYASGSQFKQALCYEKMGKNDQAVEEYVKLTYLYPDSPLVADATIRLGNYYLKQSSFKTAGKIFASFAARNATHRLAPQSMFLAAQCAYKQADYKESVELFSKTADAYPDEKVLRPEAMYWLADSCVKTNDNVKAYRTFKKVTWDYPESEWAKAARGRLTEEVFSKMAEQEQ